MTTKIPAYAKVKTITSLSGQKATSKHIVTLERSMALLEAQDTAESLAAARVLNRLVGDYLQELRLFYRSEHYPYRRNESA